GQGRLRSRERIGGEDLLLTFTDILTTPANYARMRAVFDSERCDVTAAIRNVGDPCKGAAIYLEAENDIVRIVEKPPRGTSTTPWGHAGLYCFRSEIFSYLERIGPSARGEYEVTDAVALMIAEGKRVKAVELQGMWKDLA